MAEISAAASDAAVFTIEKVYVKDLSLECPGSPQSFKAQEQPHALSSNDGTVHANP